MVSCSSWSTFNEASQKIIVVLQDLNVFVFFFFVQDRHYKKIRKSERCAFLEFSFNERPAYRKAQDIPLCCSQSDVKL